MTTVVQDTASAGREKAPLLITLMLVFVLLVPIEFSVRIGPLFMTTAKAFLIAATFVILPRLGEIRMRSYDWLMIAHTGWACLAMIHTYGIGQGVQSSGFYVLEVLVVYLLVRICIKTIGQLVAVVMVMFWMAALNGILAVPEGLTGVRYLHDFASSLTGITYYVFVEQRLGIWRSMALFEHMILLGVFCSSLFALVWFASTPRQRVWRVPLVFLGTFFSASSAPLLVFLLQGVLIVAERLTAKIKNRVSIFAGSALVLWLILENFTNRGAIGFLSILVLNPYTAYYRQAQWQYAIDDVQRNWLLGFEPSSFTRPYWMTTSIDNNWLLMTMRYGVPSLVFMVLAILMVWLALAKRQENDSTLANMRKGWGMMMLALLLAGATVAFFGKLQPLLSFYIGLGAALANCTLPQQEGSPAPRAAPEPRIRYTRFAGPSPSRQGSSQPSRPPLANARPEPVMRTAEPLATHRPPPAPDLARAEPSPREAAGAPLRRPAADPGTG